jgi:hypothetical protein
MLQLSLAVPLAALATAPRVRLESGGGHTALQEGLVDELSGDALREGVDLASKPGVKLNCTCDTDVDTQRIIITETVTVFLTCCNCNCFCSCNYTHLI